MTMNPAVTGTLDHTDAVLDALANGRRRLILRSLERATGKELPLEELADGVLEGVDSEEPPERPSKQRVLIDLYHTHLPVLEELELVVHDCEEGVVWSDADEPTLELLDLIEQYEASR